MKCTCDRARREARAEAFREAARWHRMHARMIRRDFGQEDEAASSHEEYASHFLSLSYKLGFNGAVEDAGTAIPVPPVSGNPETGRPLSGQQSASQPYDLRGAVEKLRAVWATRKDDGGLPDEISLSAAVAKLVEDDGFITEWPDSYPFKDLAWPDNPAEACK